MPLYISVIKGNNILYFDRLSSIYFEKHYIELLKIIEKKLCMRFPLLETIFSRRKFKNTKALIDEAIRFLIFLRENEKNLPKAYFYTVLPKDFSDVVSLITGGASSISLPTGEGLYELIGGFGKALLYKNGTLERKLKEYEEIEFENVKIKVFYRTSYEAVKGVIKTLITASLIADKNDAYITISESKTF